MMGRAGWREGVSGEEVGGWCSQRRWSGRADGGVRGRIRNSENHENGCVRLETAAGAIEGPVALMRVG